MTRHTGLDYLTRDPACKCGFCRESLAARIRRLSCYIDSTRFALTEADVRWDYLNADRYREDPSS